MQSKKVTLKNKNGLHARPATELAKLAMQFPCRILFIAKGQTIDAKSPLMLLSAGLERGTEIKMECDGEKEKEALEALVNAFENQFGEK